MRRLRPLILAACLAVPAAAQAHYYWVESSPQGAVLRFGEHEEGVHERSPGRLDDLPMPSAWRAGSQGPEALKVERQAAGFGLGRNATGAVWAEQSAVKVRDQTRSGSGIVKPMYYARHAASAASVPAALTLDILPAGEMGRFAVSFRGQPLPKATVKIVAPNGWAQEGRTDEQGLLTVPMPWRGQFILQVAHVEAAPGEYEGSAYENLRHVATLTIDQPKGPKTFTPDFGKH